MLGLQEARPGVLGIIIQHAHQCSHPQTARRTPVPDAPGGLPALELQNYSDQMTRPRHPGPRGLLRGQGSLWRCPSLCHGGSGQGCFQALWAGPQQPSSVHPCSLPPRTFILTCSLTQPHPGLADPGPLVRWPELRQHAGKCQGHPEVVAQHCLGSAGVSPLCPPGPQVHRPRPWVLRRPLARQTQGVFLGQLEPQRHLGLHYVLPATLGLVPAGEGQDSNATVRRQLVALRGQGRQ